MNRAAGQRLKLAREQSGLSPEDAAHKLKRSVHTYRAWERGEKFPSSTDDMAALCDLFEISLDWWIRGIDPNEQAALNRLPKPIRPHIQEILTFISRSKN